MLIASTPEGARDFVVPSRLHPGEFYALPQSPQLFKQLCMVGGMERYFQVARCMRDEDLRADRQFEFTQLDLEASFVGEADVRAFTEVAVAAAVEAVTGEPPLSFGSITWLDAMERFGSDKPDMRFGMELVELTEIFGATEFKAFQAPCVKGIRVPGGADKTRRELDALVETAQSLGAKGLVWMKVDGPSDVTSPVAKFLSESRDHRSGRRPGRRGRGPAAPGCRRAPSWSGTSSGILRTQLGAAARERGRPALPVGRGLPALRGDGRRRAAHLGPPPVHDAPRRRPRTSWTKAARPSSTCGPRPTT